MTTKSREELYAEIARLVSEAKSTTGRIKAMQARADREGGRDLTDDDQREVDRLCRRFEKIEDEIQELEGQVRDLDEAENSRSRGRVVPPQQPASGGSRGGAFAQPAGPPTFANLFRNGASDPYSGRFHSFADFALAVVGSSRVDLQACKLEYSIVSPK